jgi:hypothetical protein
LSTADNRGLFIGMRKIDNFYFSLPSFAALPHLFNQAVKKRGEKE